METKCKTCGFSLQEFAARLELGGPYSSIHCPVCGTRIVERAEFAGVFYDEEEKTYVIWDLKMQRTTGPATETKRVGEFELSLTGKSLNPNDLCYERVVV